MTSIKKISGEVLLYLYLLQRQDVGSLKDLVLSFNMWHLPEGQDGVHLENRSETVFKLDKFESYSDNDIYNALVYLYDSNFIEYNDSQDSAGSNLINLKVTSSGIDIIESIERGAEERRNFNTIFNFNITNKVTIDSLLKVELGSILKASLL